MLADSAPQIACQALLEQANSSGGSDHISLILSRIEAIEEGRASMDKISSPSLRQIRKWRQLQEEHGNEQAWRRQDHDLSAFIGEDVYLYFYVDNDGNGESAAMYLDDVSLQVCRE